MLLGAVAQAQNFAITATTEAAIRKNIVKGNAANYGFGMINDTLKLVGLTTRNVIFTGSTSKTDIGLGNVDNTSDLNKPVSTATQTALNLKQNQLNGTGFVKASGTTISYDNSTYLSTSTAASTYLPIANPTATGTLTAPTIANSLGATFATTSGSVSVGTTSTSAKLNVTTTGAAGAIFTTADYGLIDLTNGTSRLRLQNYDNTPRIATVGAYSLVFAPNEVEKVRIFSNGRVGINTTTDAGYLTDINGTLRTANDAYFATTSGNVGIGTTTPASKLHIVGGGSTTSLSNLNTTLTTRIDNANPAISLGFGYTGSDVLFQQSYNNVNNTATNLSLNPFGGNVGIGTTTPVASAILDITSTTKGVLFPRMTTDQINAISSPANGLTVYNTTLTVLCFYDGTGWRKVSHSSM